MACEEDVTDYIIRVERASTGLRSAGETITDNLVIAMILKGLPEAFKPFVVVHTQLDKYKTLTEFKAALTKYANTEALLSPANSSAMASKAQKFGKHSSTTTTQGNVQCLSCSKIGHKSKDCRSKSRLKCNFCHKPGHVESVCFKKKQSSAHSLSVDADFSFITTHQGTANERSERLLVDCGATCHIINDKKHFTSYDDTFIPDKHFIELADGKRSNKIAIAKGSKIHNR